VILVTAVGWLIQYLTGLDNLLPFAILAGLLIAPFIPPKSSCPL
jgi:hypothetical protein